MDWHVSICKHLSICKYVCLHMYRSTIASNSLSVSIETERKRGTRTSQLSALWKVLHNIWKFKDSSESSHWRETIQL